MEKETLWLPEGYGKNTIIYDKEMTPYTTVERMNVGVNLWSIEAISEEEANIKIKAGFSILKATK